MADYQKMKILAFTWNTQSLWISRGINDEIYTLTQEEEDELAKIENLREQRESQLSDYSLNGYFVSGLNMFSDASQMVKNATYAAYKSATTMAQSAGSGIAGYMRWSIYNASSFRRLLEMINNEKPDVVTISLVESAKPGDYLISHILPSAMKEINYFIQHRTRFIGGGVSSTKTGTGRGLRMAVFVRGNANFGNINVPSKSEGLKEYFTESYYNCSNSVMRGKGGICTYMNVPQFGRIAFIAFHLPHNAKTLIEHRVNDLPTYMDSVNRQGSINDVNKCFNDGIKELVINYQHKTPLNAVFVMGDLNYRIQAPSALKFAHYMLKSSFNPSWVYKNLDELNRETVNGNVHTFIEGIDGEGPSFRPTCKMSQGRDASNCETKKVFYKDVSNYTKNENVRKLGKVDLQMNRITRLEADKSDFKIEGCWNLGKYDQRVPSWCDRILYQVYGVDGKKSILSIECEQYNRYDEEGVISQSDHSGLFGIYNLTKI